HGSTCPPALWCLAMPLSGWSSHGPSRPCVAPAAGSFSRDAIVDPGWAGISLLAGKKQGNFISSGLRHSHMASKKPSRSITHSYIPYAPEQGIDRAVAGNFVRSSRKSSVGSGKTRASSCPSVKDSGKRANETAHDAAWVDKMLQ